MISPTNILIFGEGGFTRQLTSFYGQDSGYNVIGYTHSAAKAREFAENFRKLIIIIDIDHRSALVIDELIECVKLYNVRFIAVCDDIKLGFELLGKGVHEMCIKPKDNSDTALRTFFMNLASKTKKVVKEFDLIDKALKNRFSSSINTIIAIGSSTGGTECILQILKSLPADTPPVLVVQHMPPVFTKLYSNRLNSECQMSVWEAGNGDKLENGLALIAPGDMHMELIKRDGAYYVRCYKGEPHSGHIPSVDVMFNSVANIAGQISIGVILTGMGKDGANGLLKMKNAGAYTIGQDQRSSIVYGMPKVAYDIGAVEKQCDPDGIANAILDKINKRGLKLF